MWCLCDSILKRSKSRNVFLDFQMFDIFLVIFVTNFKPHCVSNWSIILYVPVFSRLLIVMFRSVCIY